ncbi:amino acid adenylation domain-containing protein, partial [Lonsdalea quercina]|uniref:amino acid adenylation domain-containing protein n=1 Tax=Lonsdalea quercina TaxID=71657 RepID=UPI0039769BCC
HQDLPFEQLVEALNPTRSLSHSPLFQTLLAWQNASDDALQLQGLQVEPYNGELLSAKTDLLLSLGEEQNIITGHLEYASSVFDRATVERYARYLKMLLRAMVSDETQPVAQLPLLTDDERHSLLHDRNHTEAEPVSVCLHQQFEAQARREPQAIALVFGEQRLSYDELNRRANQLAHALMAQGVGPESRVAISLPRGVEMVVAVLAVLKAGGGYVPIDPTYPAERIRYLLEDSAPLGWITEGALWAQTPTDVRLFDLEAPALLVGQPEGNPDQAADPHQLAYVIYTSGSTGQPKGVMVEHAQVMRLFASTRRWFDFGADDVWSLFHSLSFDFSVWELWGALLHGGRLVVVAQETARTPAAFYQLLCEQGVTVLNQTPGAFRPLIAAQAEAPPSLSHALRWVIFGGEALEPAMLAPWYAQNGERTTLVNMYGITETTVHVTYRPFSPADTALGVSPIGERIPDLRIYVLDEAGQPVPVGVAGELYVGGAGVARGYLNRAALTAARFIDDPFVDEPGARLYKTGDRARWSGEGALEYLGRNDHQVKIRGFRIELGEIAARLRRHPAVDDSVVIARQDADGDSRLVAYYLAGEPLDAQSLRDWVAAELPDYMLPGAWVHLSAWPLTAHGKLDRQALPEPDAGAYAVQRYEAPRGETETTLAGLWSALLGVEAVGRHDHFFALGGHSLLAIQLLSRVRQQLGRDVALSTLFAHPVLAAFAQAVGQAPLSALPPIAPADRTGRLALSFAQLRLWFLSQLEANASAAYHMAGGVRLEGELNVEALQAALDGLVARHESLRTGFVAEDGTPYQQIHAPRPFALHRHDLRGHADAEGELSRLAEAASLTAFDLSHGPLIRGSLIVLDDRRQVLLFTLHHIISDGWSVGLFMRELGALYDALTAGKASPLPPLRIQYADYAAWQRRWIDGPRLQTQLGYWREQLAEVPPLLALPTDRPRPAVQDYAGGRVDFTLDAGLTAGLKRLAARHDATLYMTLLTGWAILLHRLSGQDDIVIGSPVAGRTHTELEPLIGLFVNMLALRCRIADNATVGELLAQVKATTLAAQAHQDLPFEQLVEALNPARSLAHSPLFQTMLAWQNAAGENLRLGELQAEPFAFEQVTAQFDLSLALGERDDRIEGGIDYASSLFYRETVERYVDHWQVLLRAMVLDADQDIARLPLLSDVERRQVLYAWNDTCADYPQEQGIHHLFEAQVQRTPQAVALVCDEQSLTYDALNQRANRLAHVLIAKGVEADARVAICLPRGVDMVVAVLAVLKAGGAYVPVDPAYPQSRILYMLEDSQPRVLMTLGELWESPPDVPEIIDLAAAQNDVAISRNPDIALKAESLAYVIYTSGSSGQPKGVMVPHRGVVNLLLSVMQRIDLRTDDRLLSVTTLNFDIAALELFSPLLCGARLVLADRDTILDPERLARCIRDRRISVMQATPSVWRMLLESRWHKGLRLRSALCGGEALSHELALRLLTLTDSLWNLYGPTETTIWSTAQRVCEETDNASAPPIGQPLANTRVYILDARGEPVPIGVFGEIHIAGDGVTRGYLNRPDMTAERFVPDPFISPQPESAVPLMYRTGDLGRWRADGRIAYYGRNDNEVKIRGVRIHPAEIESALLEHAGVQDAVVIGDKEKRLVAYVVAPAQAVSQDVDTTGFSLFYFGGDSRDQRDKYALYLEAAQYADRHGFEAIWTPERHFHPVGGLYPNPSVLNAALATITQRISLRSGSVVLPLHHPVRVAEEWSMVDNLSHGRVGLAVASGWNPKDFVLAPDGYAARKQVMFDGVEMIKTLWRGETISLPDGAGKETDIHLYPEPIQAMLPIWVTAAGNPETFIQAGKAGTHLLTHLMGQQLDELAEHIALYRQARAEAGHDPDAGHVTLMVHTFIGTDLNATLAKAKTPFIDYLKLHFGLNFFSKDMGMPSSTISDHDMDAMTTYAFEHYSSSAALIGTPQSCLPIVQAIKNSGVDEIACLIDWMDAESALDGLPHLNDLQQLAKSTAPSTRELRQFLARRLPGHMIPDSVMFLDALPMTANGKIDRHALPAVTAVTETHDYAPPEGELESTVVSLWGELLDVKRIGRHDNFFELGGNSLMVVSLLERLRQAAIPAEVRMLFANPTPASLAEAINHHLRLAAEANSGDSTPDTIEVTF